MRLREQSVSLPVNWQKQFCGWWLIKVGNSWFSQEAPLTKFERVFIVTGGKVKLSLGYLYLSWVYFKPLLAALFGTQGTTVYTSWIVKLKGLRSERTTSLTESKRPQWLKRKTDTISQTTNTLSFCSVVLLFGWRRPNVATNFKFVKERRAAYGYPEYTILWIPSEEHFVKPSWLLGNSR